MGGEHKCPLCSATFTRPQHVGRHLRAHTGDRPYECKECPLRFARSDLLSRHVNKAHRPPDENGKPPQGKKGRRKSLPSSAHPQPQNGAGAASETDKLRRASMDQARPNINGQATAQMPPFTGGSFNTAQPQQSQPPLQAQRMYPHHPLLAGTPPTQTISMGSWTSSPPTDMMAMSMPNLSMPFSTSANMLPQTIGPNGFVSFQPPFTALPMRMSGSDQGASAMGRGGSMGSVNSLGSLSGMGYEFGFKKRACDQCNHSKVRCDFAEPCHRCAHRNLHCTYIKPQKSRAIPNTSSPKTSLPMSASNSGLSGSNGGNSASPQSQFSSPTSTTSPVTATMGPPSLPRPQFVHGSINDPSSIYAQSQPWNTDQWQNLVNVPMDQNLGLIQQHAAMLPTSAPTGSALSPSVGQAHPLPLQHRSSGSSTDSPQTYLAPTPSLTSHSTSPSGSDEPTERPLGGVTFTPQWGSIKGKSADNINFPMDGHVATSVSPPTANASANIPLTTQYPDVSNLFAWAPPATATIDPRLQFRNAVNTDEEDINTSRPGSSNASTYRDGLDEQTINALNGSRRTSLTTGVWANAFDQMSLQDPSSALAPDPYTASQMAHLATRRPSFPVLPASHSSNASKIPSMGNVNELWKLFMAEPISATMGHSSSTDYMDLNINNNLTPRPNLGARGMSRSNSMPDLTTPLNGQQFFASHGSGVTPKPTLPQASYTQSQIEAGAGEGAEDNKAALKQWKASINDRQASFVLDAKVQSKLKSTSPSDSVSQSIEEASKGATAASLDEASVPLEGKNRPQASVLQRTSALQQTLAPERLPSFGFSDLPTPIKNGWAPRQNAAKFTSALARPGNKRLASQTLVPGDSGKKFEFDGGAWDGLDQNGQPSGSDSRGFNTPIGLSGLSTGMTPSVGGNQYFAWSTTAPNPAS